jgi:hypothetical protein
VKQTVETRVSLNIAGFSASVFSRSGFRRDTQAANGSELERDAKRRSPKGELQEWGG